MSDSAGGLANRIVLVTGATRGLGQAIALALVDAGAHVLALGRTRGALEALDDQAGRRAGSVTLVPFDLAKPEKVPELARSIYQRFGALHGLVGNAAMLGTIGPLAHQGFDDWARVIRVNLLANIALLQAFDPPLR
ncbi:MAG: SDR family NAD(P)-dependent oxidoreductase, partial [Pseudomonadota bacterium]